MLELFCKQGETMNAKVGAIIAAVLILGILGLVAFNQTKDEGSKNNTTAPSNSNQGDSQEPAKTFTAEEVGTHSSKEDCWAIINGSVYDLTNFISSHPGGEEIIRACGIDATTLFETRTTQDGETVGSGSPHSSSAASQLESLKIGELAQ